MTRIRLLALGILIASPAYGETLQEAIDAAYASNPELSEARFRQKAVEEGPEQARAAGGPTLSTTVEAGYDRQGSGRAGTAILNATVPVWDGGRTSSSVRAATAEVAAGEQVLRDREADVVQQVVSAYAELLAEAKSRFDLGDGTLTDVARITAQRSSLVANLADSEAAEAAAKATYRALVGREPGDLTLKVTRSALLPATLDEAREEATASNPLLLQQQRLVDASEARIDNARAQNAPSLQLGAAYGRGVRAAGDDLKDYESSASINFTLNLPFDIIGRVSSKIREADAIYNAERFVAIAKEREAIRGVETAWSRLVSANKQVDANEKGVEAAQLALRGVNAEYAFGLRSTVDILLAEQDYRALQLSLARSKSDVLTAEASVLRVIGRLTQLAYVE
jgi:outer membrane protein